MDNKQSAILVITNIADIIDYILKRKMGIELSKVVICADVIHGDGVCFNIYGGRANVFLAKKKRESDPDHITHDSHLNPYRRQKKS